MQVLCVTLTQKCLGILISNNIFKSVYIVLAANKDKRNRLITALEEYKFY